MELKGSQRVGVTAMAVKVSSRLSYASSQPRPSASPWASADGLKLSANPTPPLESFPVDKSSTSWPNISSLSAIVNLIRPPHCSTRPSGCPTVDSDGRSAASLRRPGWQRPLFCAFFDPPC